MTSPAAYNLCALARPENADALYFPKTRKAMWGMAASGIATVAIRMLIGRPSWKVVGLIEGGLLAGGMGIEAYRNHHATPEYKLDRFIWHQYVLFWRDDTFLSECEQIADRIAKRHCNTHDRHTLKNCIHAVRNFIPSIKQRIGYDSPQRVDSKWMRQNLESRYLGALQNFELWDSLWEARKAFDDSQESSDYKNMRFAMAAFAYYQGLLEDPKRQGTFQEKLDQLGAVVYEASTLSSLRSSMWSAVL